MMDFSRSLPFFEMKERVISFLLQQSQQGGNIPCNYLKQAGHKGDGKESESFRECGKGFHATTIHVGRIPFFLEFLVIWRHGTA